MNSRYLFPGLVTLLLSGLTVLIACTPSRGQKSEAQKVSFNYNDTQTHGLLFGEGSYGVVLSHGAIYDAASWKDLAEAIASNGMVALALEEVDPQNLNAARNYLKEKRNVDRVALIGASAGGATAARAVAGRPEAWDQLILLSPAGGNAPSLGTIPKLFIASKSEGLAERVQKMAQNAPGQDNKFLLLEGSAHAQAIFTTNQAERLTNVIIERLLKSKKEQ